jgi:hypothetical protein
MSNSNDQSIGDLINGIREIRKKKELFILSYLIILELDADSNFDLSPFPEDLLGKFR